MIHDILSPQSGQATRLLVTQHVNRWVCRSVGQIEQPYLYQLPVDVQSDARQLARIGHQVIATSIKRFADGKPLDVSQTKPQIAMGLTPSMVEELHEVLTAIVHERLDDVAQQLEQCRDTLNQ